MSIPSIRVVNCRLGADVNATNASDQTALHGAA
jgi:hypothetical protein